jgi:hypothetical protein
MTNDIGLQVTADRANRAMYNAEQKFGHGSPAHAVAWTVFCEARSALDGEKIPRAYSRGELSLALDYVEALCSGKRGRKGFDVAAAVLELAERPHTMYVRA